MSKKIIILSILAAVGNLIWVCKLNLKFIKFLMLQKNNA